MTTFRKTLMATTVLAGFAIFAFDAALARPNSPNIGGGGISSFSSMRMDFNRVGGPGRMLSRNDTRVVPLDVKKTEKAPKESKSAAKKGIDVARVSNPKPAGGGKGKDVASAPALRIPAPLADLYDVTGGNLDDISQLAELATWLTTGLPGLGSPLFPIKGDGSWVLPTLGADGRFGWGDTKGGPSNNTPQRIGNPDGKASGGGFVTWSETTTKRSENGVSYYTTTRVSRWISGDGSTGHNDAGVEFMTEEHTSSSDGSRTSTVTYDGPGGHLVVTNKLTLTATSDEEPASDQKADEEPQTEKETADNEKDSQPTEEGSGRPRGMHTVRCDIAGCLDLGMSDGRRVNPGHAEGSGAASGGGRALPSWATDPCPDCTSRGGGGGLTGFTPQDEGDGGPDGPGGPSM